MNSAEPNRGALSGPDAGAHLLLWNDRLSAFVDDALSEDECREVLAHLEVCEVCRARVQAYLGLRGVVSALPRRAAPRIPYLRRQEGRRFAWNPAPALWAFSGALGILMILFLTRPLFVGHQSMLERVPEEALLRHAAGVKEAPRMAAAPDNGAGSPSLEGAIPENGGALKSAQEGAPATEGVAPAEKGSGGAAETAQGLPAETAGDRETERERQREAPPSVPPSVQESAKPAADLALPRGAAAAPESTKAQEPGPAQGILRVTLVLPLEEANAEKRREESAGGEVSTGERVPPASLRTAMAPPSAQTVSFILPQKEWEALEEFLKKHYALVIMETAPGELRVTLAEAETSPDSSQKREEKKNEDGKSRKRKPILP